MHGDEKTNTFTQVSDAQLRDYLLATGMVPRRTLLAMLEQSELTGKDFRRVLLDTGTLSPDELRRAIAGIVGVPFVRLTRDDMGHDAMMKIPEPLSRAHNAIGYRMEGAVLEVAMLDLNDLEALSFLQPEVRIIPRLTTAESLKTALLLYQRHLKQEFGDSISREAHAVIEPTSVEPHDLMYAAQRLPVSNLVDLLLRHALVNRASDVHLDRTPRGLLIRYRIAGTLTDAMLLPRHTAASVILRLKLLAHVPLTTVVPREGRFRVQGANGTASVVLSSVQTAQGERLVLHIVPEHIGREGFALESLGFHGQSIERMHKLLAHRSGLIVVAGNLSAGKTTTLYTMLDLLTRNDRSVISVEDTVEHRLPHISQVQPNAEIGVTYISALRAALKQDPDVLMVSSLAERDVAELALAAANRGILVLAGVEAPDAAAGIDTLAQLVSSEMLAATLVGAVGVARTPRLCEQYDKHKLVRAEVQAIENIADPVRVLAALKDELIVDSQAAWKELEFPQAITCPHCKNGYIGDIGLQEVIPITHTLKENIRTNAGVESYLAQAHHEGVLNIAGDGVYKAAQGRTTLEEVLKVAGGAD
ncbi:MAG: Tfp pilus assembly protein PilB, type pilus assembly protein PilB [Candidatus Adlerbacteria bacterium]|nr:Tfp pilus assembly protein PilB, type pilus assembly protein PilB [Candidatus Adlerbacteria bacterium]